MSFPNIKDPNFNKKIASKFKDYKIPKKRKSFDEICFPKKFEKQIPQQFVAQYMGPKTPYKGILIFHKIGAGKSCSAVSIGESWKLTRKIVVLVPASLIGNFRGELRSECADNSYLSDIERRKLKKLHPNSIEYKAIIKKSDERINKYYQIYSYHKFTEMAENKQISLRNSVLIIDEIQNMVSEKGKFYDVLYKAIHDAPTDLRIVLLSATPMFDRPVEIALTMNLLRIPFELPTGREFQKMFIKLTKNQETKEIKLRSKNLDIFKERIRGFVSYFRGAPPYVFPETKIKYVQCIMSDFQYSSYKAVVRNERKEKHNKKVSTLDDIFELPNNFFLGTRIISNVAYPNQKINDAGLELFKGKLLDDENLDRYSMKFFKIIKKVKQARGPVIVYSSFKEFGGLRSFAKVLEHNGFRDYALYGEGLKRYGFWSGDSTIQLREEIKAVYNQTTNLGGKKLKVLLVSPSGKEGFSAYGVQQIHILEPYWNQSRLDQIIGRGVRFCSHKNLPEEQRLVKVYIYLSVHPKEKLTIDQYIYNLARKKDKLIKEFEQALKEIAIDCELNMYANVYEEEGEPKLICE